MPNIAFAPRPMVDPYGGKTGEIVGELFSTIGQIHLLRQQRNQSNAILDIMKSDWSPEEKQAGILRVAQNGGDVFRNMMARQGLADALVPESERRLQQARLESTQALTKWRSEGGARGAKSAGIEGMTITELQAFRIKEEKAKREYESITNQPANKLKKDPARLAEYDRQIQLVNKRISELTGGGKPTRGPAGVPFKADVDAVTGAAPVTGQSPQVSAAPVETVGPPVPDIYGVVLKSFRSAKDISSADKQARKELVAKGLAKDDDQAASMILDAVGKMPSLNKIMPTGADTGQRPGAFVQAATAPQLAPSTQAEPQSQEYPKISSPEELDKLPSGTLFISPNGELRRKK